MIQAQDQQDRLFDEMLIVVAELLQQKRPCLCWQPIPSITHVVAPCFQICDKSIDRIILAGGGSLPPVLASLALLVVDRPQSPIDTVDQLIAWLKKVTNEQDHAASIIITDDDRRAVRLLLNDPKCGVNLGRKIVKKSRSVCAVVQNVALSRMKRQDELVVQLEWARYCARIKALSLARTKPATIAIPATPTTPISVMVAENQVQTALAVRKKKAAMGNKYLLMLDGINALEESVIDYKSTVAEAVNLVNQFSTKQARCPCGAAAASSSSSSPTFDDAGSYLCSAIYNLAEKTLLAKLSPAIFRLWNSS